MDKSGILILAGLLAGVALFIACIFSILGGIGGGIGWFSDDDGPKISFDKKGSIYATSESAYEDLIDQVKQAKIASSATETTATTSNERRIFFGKYNTVSEHLTGGLYWIHIKDFDVTCVGFNGGGLSCDWEKYHKRH